MMFRFGHSEYLYLLILIPILVIVFIVAYRGRKKALDNFGNWEVIKQLIPDISFSRPVIKFIVYMLILTSIIFALARPQYGSKLQEVKRKGVELIIALDVSNSMLAQDIQPNRLERAKQAISKLVDRLRNDKIGLIVFAGDAYIQLPITTDYSAARLFLNSISPSIVPKQGTAIGSAIDMAMSSFTPESDMNRAIIVITDGENHEDDAVEMAKKANEKGIIVHTLGMGLPKGAPIPVNPDANAKTYRKDRQGNIIISKLDEVMLQKIAVAGDGIYIRATNTKTGLNTLFDEINKMEKKEIGSKVYSEYDDQFQYFVALAIILLLIDFLIFERKNRYLKNIKLFKIKI